MIIDEITTVPELQANYLNSMPDQFKTQKEKTKPSYVKATMDFFANVAFNQYRRNVKTFVKNYDLLKGVLKPEDLYQAEPEVRSFIETLSRTQELPQYVKHYSILNSPINTMVGELSKRPDITKVRAFDADSQNEELEFKDQLIESLIVQEGKKMLIRDMEMKGQDISSIADDEVASMSLDKVKEQLMSFTSTGETWGNHMLTALKVDLNIKEKHEEVFLDLLTCSRQMWHIYEDNSKRGFNATDLNPKNYWQLGTKDAKYTSAVSGHKNVPYANGTVHVMEISEIIEEFPDLTVEEIDHLRKTVDKTGYFTNSRTTTNTNGLTGPNSIQYDTYSPLLAQERAILASEMDMERSDMDEFLGIGNTIQSFGYKFTVVRAYWQSKLKVGKLTYMDEEGTPQTVLVDDTYKAGAPNEISIEWGWINMMYQGDRIGNEVYHVKPFKLLDYSPIIGIIHGGKNSTAKSLLDMMKNFQTLYNICLNQLYELLGKEKGNVAAISLRHVPTPKDGDPQDSLEIWEEDAKERGIIFLDDSLENTKGASQMGAATHLDLTRTQEIQSRYTLAAQLKAECWELVGMNRQRLGAPSGNSTATENQNSLVQSFAQTEPYFAADEYVLNQFYQGLLDAAQYVESNKEESNISYIATSGEEIFWKVAGADIRLRDLKVFITSRSEDQQLLNEFRQLSQPMLQNGASVYDISVLYTTNSLRQMQKIFKDLKDKQEQYQAQTGQLEQQKVQQEQQIAQAELEQNEQHHQEDLQMKKYEIDVKANTDITKAEISTYFQAPTTDSDSDGTPDIMEIADYSLRTRDSIDKRDLERDRLSFEMQKEMNASKAKKVDQQLAKEKIKNEKERTKVMAKKAVAKPKAK